MKRFRVLQKKRHTVIECTYGGKRPELDAVMLWFLPVVKGIVEDRGGLGIQVGYENDPDDPQKIIVWMLPARSPAYPFSRITPHQLAAMRAAFKAGGFDEPDEPIIEPAPEQIHTFEDAIRRSNPQARDFFKEAAKAQE